MLQLSVTNINIRRINETLGEQPFESSITDSMIIIYTDEIPDDVIEVILENATINGIQNYKSDTSEANTGKPQNDLDSKLTGLNEIQLQLLSTVNMEELSEILNSKGNDKEKVRKILKLFGFDMLRNGMEYVQQAILLAIQLKGYNLESLAKVIAQKKHVEANEVSRVIVARIKENFRYKKLPAILFIRLIERLLKGG